MASLRYGGKGSLTFQDRAGNRRILRAGEEFEADEATAEILLSSESEVSIVSSAKKGAAQGSGEAARPTVTLPAGQPDPNAPPMTEASPAVSSSEAEPLAAPPPEGGTLSVPGPTEPGSADEDLSQTGSVSLGDLPASAKVGGQSESGARASGARASSSAKRGAAQN